MTKRAPAKRPPIHMIDSEADTLTDLALARQDQSPALAELLLQEIDRAKIYTAAKIPADIVTMHSRVEFVDEGNGRSEEHTSELQSLMRISYAVFCLKKKKSHDTTNIKT